MALAVCTAVLVQGAEPKKKKAKAKEEDPALVQARQEEATSRAEENSREMARSATREIARAERNRAEETLKNWKVANAAVAAATAVGRPQAEIVALRQAAQERLKTLRSAAERLIIDTQTANLKSRELFVSEMDLRDKMSATRQVELKLLNARPLAEGADEKSPLKELTALEALRLMEIRQWMAIRKDTAMELAEQSGEAARIAREIAAVESDPAQKQRLKQFADSQIQEKTEADNITSEALAAIADAAPRTYAVRSAAMGGLQPLAPEQWDYAKARHLLVRAGFGGTPEEVEKIRAMGLYKAVDYLVDFYHQPAAGPVLDPVPILPTDPLASKMKMRGVGNRAVELDPRTAEQNQPVQIRRWWLARMVESPRPLQEKLTLFWHGLFASQNSVVQNSYAMFRQNELFREHAAGSYAALLYGIVHDPAMIRYLDNNRNVKGNPNENLAREIMELFSMGVDQGYTEKDIIEAARALTGYTFDNATGTFRFDYSQHDTTDKTIFGKTGPWTGDDLVRLILERPETTRFVGRRLFEYFAYPDPDAEVVESLANVLRDRQYALAPMLKNLFLSQEFYSERSMGKQIKSPVELMVGLLRDLGVKPVMLQQSIETPLSKTDGSRLAAEINVTTYGALDEALQQMGMQLLEPPDVKGWRYGRPWIDSQRLFVRYNAVASLIDAIGQEGIDLVGVLQAAGCNGGGQAVDYLAKACLVRPLNPERRQELITYLGQLPPRGQWTSRRDDLNQRLRSVLMLMLCVPEHQMS
jgi:hypothetical protein